MFTRFLAAVVAAYLLALAFPLSLPDLPLPWPWGMLPIPLPGAADSGSYSQLPWLAFLCLIPLLEIARTSRSGVEAFLFGYLAGAIWLMLHLSWLSSFGLLPVVLLACYFALPVGLFTVAARWLISGGRPGLVLWAIPLIWTALEYLRSFGFWSFPWNLLGYSQVRNLPLLQVADLGGVYAVTFLIVLVNSALFVLLSPLGSPRLRLGHVLGAAGLLCFALAYGETRLNLETEGQPEPVTAGNTPGQAPNILSVALVQGGEETFQQWSRVPIEDTLELYLPPSRKALRDWQPVSIETIRTPGPAQRTISRSVRRDLLIVWPESTLPRMIDPRQSHRLPPEVRELTAAHSGAALLMGAIGRPRDEQHEENGCLLLDSNGLLSWIYSKVRLVPYGEVVPFREVVRFLQYPWGKEDISAGSSAPLLRWRSYNLGTGVCFDNVFGFIARRQVRSGASALILMTNNSWYKLHSGIRQHCDIDIMRAVEYRRSVARCSTTGWSHIISPTGETLANTPVSAAGLIERDLPLRTELSPYLIIGDLFAQLCLVATLLICLPLLIVGRSEGLL